MFSIEDIKKFEKSELFKDKYAYLLGVLNRMKPIAISSKELELNLGITDRQIRSLVQYARMQGEPVCSNNNGYYMTDDFNDVFESADRLIRHGKSEIIMGRRMKKKTLLKQEQLKLAL